MATPRAADTSHSMYSYEERAQSCLVLNNPFGVTPPFLAVPYASLYAFLLYIPRDLLVSKSPPDTLAHLHNPELGGLFPGIGYEGGYSGPLQSAIPPPHEEII